MRILLSLLLSALCLLLAAPGASAAKLNVLFIVADDLNTDLGCYGHPLVKTPHLQRLAGHGILFQRAYCQSPICNPSRTSFLSGRRPSDKLKNVVFLPEFFRSNGWQTIEVNKFTHSYGVTATAIRWDANVNGGAERVVGLLEEKRKVPFFIAVGLTDTHPGYNFDRKYLEMYPPEKIILPKEAPEFLKDMPAAAFTGMLVKKSATVEERREHMARYYAAISTLDAQIGVICDALDRLGLWDNAIVIFTSDHGRHLGDFAGIYDKRTLFEASLRVPLLVSTPGTQELAAGKSRECARLVELVDLYPTLAKLCELQAPKDLHGKSFAPLLEDPQLAWKKAAFSEVHLRGAAGRSVCTERYRYTEFTGIPTGILSDLQDDERHNLYSDPKHDQVLQELKALAHSQ